MPRMTDQEWHAYLRRRNIASLVTLKADGSPHVSPVWYLLDGAAIYVFTGKGTVKARNLARDARAAFCVASRTRPYRAVLLEGQATLLEEGLEDMVRRISVRYAGRREGGTYARRVLSQGGLVLIRLAPEKVMAWSIDLGED
ncbi:MAG: PPOX class F420-dependent oxidoreductase [Chloroflexi bacterium]|nr:PPOX class F420-dependent oxidoreductase [Chloroflexota bacterium]